MNSLACVRRSSPGQHGVGRQQVFIVRESFPGVLAVRRGDLPSDITGAPVIKLRSFSVNGIHVKPFDFRARPRRAAEEVK